MAVSADLVNYKHKCFSMTLKTLSNFAYVVPGAQTPYYRGYEKAQTLYYRGCEKASSEYEFQSAIGVWRQLGLWLGLMIGLGTG